MPRRVEDIVPSNRRTIREIEPAPRARARARRRATPDKDEREEDAEIKEIIPVRKSNNSSGIRVTPPPTAAVSRIRKSSRASKAKKIGVGIVVAVIAIVAGTAYIASTYFSHATFTIVPVTIPITVSSNTIVATGTSTPGYIRYQILKYSGAASTTLPAADGTVTSTKATGSVTLFNAYSTQGQRLIAGTRFAGDNGLVYRLQSSVVVPGYTSSGVNLSPGTIRATVVADEAGSQYNMAKNDGGTDLRVVAYKGAPRYDTIYAKAYGGMTGGFVGTKKIVHPTLLASTTADVQAALTKSLVAQALAHVPEGYVSYPTAYNTMFNPTDVGGNDPKKAVVTVSGTLYSIIFKKTDLAAKLAGQDTVDRFGKSPYSIDGIENLSFTITNPSTFRASKTNTLIARFSGSLTLKGIVPVSELTHKLAGLPLSDTRPIFASYGSVIDISKSSGELFPSWAGAVPKDEKRITVNLKDE
ncbi:MAG TPA: hypothetical protein VF438_00870 [Candidatus Paceibacterota bacterium]